MTSKSEDLILFDEEIIANQILKLYGFRIEHPDLTIKDACEELGMHYQRALTWLKSGKIHEYLDRIHDVRSDMSQILALNELPSIVEYQARIARGEASPRGANPTAAAQFILDVAKLGSKDNQNRALSQINVFVPSMGKERNEAPTTVDASFLIKES